MSKDEMSKWINAGFLLVLQSLVLHFAMLPPFLGTLHTQFPHFFISSRGIFLSFSSISITSHENFLSWLQSLCKVSLSMDFSLIVVIICSFPLVLFFDNICPLPSPSSPTGCFLLIVDTKDLLQSQIINKCSVCWKSKGVNRFLFFFSH